MDDPNQRVTENESHAEGKPQARVAQVAVLVLADVEPELSVVKPKSPGDTEGHEGKA